MRKCPYIGPINWLTTGRGYPDFRCVPQKSLTSVTENLNISYAVQIFIHPMFPSSHYFVILVSVFNFTSFLAFYALHYPCLQHKWQLAKCHKRVKFLSNHDEDFRILKTVPAVNNRSINFML